MKKLNVLIIASLTGLALAGGALFGDTASAKSYDPFQPQQKVEQKAKKNPPKEAKAKKAPPKVEQKAEKAPKQRELKDWEKKYYELHPEAQKKEEQKAQPEKSRHHHSEDDDIDWHRI